MRKVGIWIIVGCCLLTVASFARAQSTRKPGLWETTSIMTWQQSPLPPGMTMPPGANSPFGGGPRTSQICLTQAWIDKYGAPVPQSQNDCQVVNVSLKPSSMTADWVCSGRMAGTGTLESSWPDPNRARGKVHFTGIMQMGQNSKTVEFTIESTSVFKGSDCGSVKPLLLPVK